MQAKIYAVCAILMLIPAAAQAVPPANPTARYRAMSPQCRSVADKLRATPADSPTPDAVYAASQGRCDYRSTDPAGWKG